MTLSPHSYCSCLALCIASLGNAHTLAATDTTHIALGVSGGWGQVLRVDPYERVWIHTTGVHQLGVSITHSTRGSKDVFAAAYGYPTWSMGLYYSNYDQVHMRKEQLPEWSTASTVPYTSTAGRLWTLYTAFSRPLLQGQRWTLGYALEGGLAYATRPYRRADNVDNELLGGHGLIYFAASAYAMLRLAPRWSLRGDLALRHHSNGALYRPNKGANAWLPSLSLLYDIRPERHWQRRRTDLPRLRPRLYGTVALGIGGKVLLEDWLKTQYHLPAHDPQHRTDHFRRYLSYSLQADLMMRYATRWATGVGVDVWWASYTPHLRLLDQGLKGATHSPWSLGLAIKHETYYRNLSLFVSLGVYLHRAMGYTAELEETPYYERIGLRYRPPHWGRVSIGVAVKAHKTKADLTEIILGMDL